MKSSTALLFVVTIFATTILTTPTLTADTIALFNGKDLSGWKLADMYGSGTVNVLPDGAVECDFGNPMTGLVYTNTPLRMNYELKLEATRVQGSDFFVALTIPIETNYCTVIIGGWGGSLCGVSCYDYMDASENEWSDSVTFENKRWYTLRVRVTPGVLQIFLDENLYQARIEFDSPKRFSLRPGSDIDATTPLGLATYGTKARWRNFTATPIKNLTPADKPTPDKP